MPTTSWGSGRARTRSARVIRTVRPAARYARGIITLTCLAVSVVAAAVAAPAYYARASATFTVTTIGDTGDTAPGDGSCVATGGGCTLRAALEESNALAGIDTINFSIGSGGVTRAPRSPTGARGSAK